jgi:NAD(P)-dependent dehydrogenase (short-subunit alcohol dehydrogenase family)
MCQRSNKSSRAKAISQHRPAQQAQNPRLLGIRPRPVTADHLAGRNPDLPTSGPVRVTRMIPVIQPTPIDQNAGRETNVCKCEGQDDGEVEDIAATVCFLCLPGGRCITGQTIHVNGGIYLP